MARDSSSLFRLLFVVQLSSSLAFLGMETSAQANLPPGQLRQDVKVGDGRPVLNLELTHPLSLEEFEKLISRLRLSEAQVAAAHSMWTDYEADDLAIRSDTIPRLLERSEPYAGSGVRLSSADLRNGYRSLKRDTAMLQNRLDEAENSLFANVESLLTDMQAIDFPQVLSKRAISRLSDYPTLYPGSSICLSFLVEDLLTKSEINDISEPLAQLIQEYESILAPLFQSRVELSRRSATDSRLHQSAMYPQLEAAVGQDRERLASQFAVERRRILKKPVAISVRISQLNLEYCGLFASQLPPSIAVELRDEFFAMAFPMAFPHSERLNEVFQQLLPPESNADSGLDSITEFRDAYILSLQSSTDRLIEHVLAFHKDFAESFSSNAARSSEYLDHLNRLLSDRREHDRKTLQSLLDLLDENQESVAADQIAAIQASLSAPLREVQRAISAVR